jgi:hypothetical protein
MPGMASPLLKPLIMLPSAGQRHVTPLIEREGPVPPRGDRTAAGAAACSAPETTADGTVTAETTRVGDVFGTAFVTDLNAEGAVVATDEDEVLAGAESRSRCPGHIV